MRTALLADIHGNAIALEAVLADISRNGGVDSYWILGDLVALGPDPIGVLQQLVGLPDARFVRGNTDRYVVSGDRPSPTLDEARADSGLLDSLVEVASTFAWTLGTITAGGWLQWLKELPVEFKTSLPDGTRFLGVHASPGCDDGPGVSPGMNDNVVQELVGSCDADLVCMGHTHLPMERRWHGIHLANPGAVSLSHTPSRCACYAVLETTKDGYTIRHHQVAFDRQRVIDQLNELGHPGRAFLIEQLSGSH